MSVSGAGAAPEGRTRTPTVFEQQREELVREIAVVSSTPYHSTYLSAKWFVCLCTVHVLCRLSYLI